MPDKVNKMKEELTDHLEVVGVIFDFNGACTRHSFNVISFCEF
jgi:hypothetical protein